MLSRLRAHLWRLADKIIAVPPPVEPVFRVVTKRGGLSEPFDPPPWSIPFRGRFDDKHIRLGFPHDKCFRTIYFSSQLAGALGETLQRHIRKPEELEEAFRNKPPSNPLLLGGKVKRDELTNRQIGKTRLDQTLLFADIMATETRTVLYHTPTIAPLVRQLGLNYLDVSAVTGDTRLHRELTQEIALYVYNQTDRSKHPIYAGIRYLSHLNTNWECWAIFHDRLRHTPMSPEPINLNDPELYNTLSLLNIEMIP